MYEKNKYLTTTEAASVLKVSKRTLQRWRDEGRIGFIKVAGKVFFRWVDIEEMMNRNYHPPFAEFENNFLTLNTSSHGKKK